jgi:hypothetical protein
MPFGKLRDGNRVFTAVNAVDTSAADWNTFQDQLITCVMPYPNVYSGINDTLAGNMFMVQPAAGGGTPLRGSVALSQATVDPTPLYPCTDGKNIYYLGDDGVNKYIRALNSVTGATVWTAILDHGFITANLCTDGAYVYVGNNVDHDVNAYSCVNGAKVVQAGNNVMHSGEPKLLACNGTHVIAVNFDAECQVTVFAAVAGVLTRTATELTLDNEAQCIFCGDTHGYVGTNLAGALDKVVHVFPLTNPHARIAYWDSGLWGGLATVNGIYHDGEFIYIATDDCTEVGGAHSCAWKLALDTSIVSQPAGTIRAWGIDRTADPVAASTICGDGKYIYITTSKPRVEILDKRTMVSVFYAAAANQSWPCCDGVSYIGSDSSGAGSIKRYYNGENTVGYRRGAATDPRRFPIQGSLAIPVW